MKVDQFWNIIASSRRGFDPSRRDGNMDQQAEELRRLLSELPPEELLEFDRHFTGQMNAAYRWDLWGAAHLIAGACSEDGFVDFRSWLISMGRHVFEEALSNAESLLDVADAPGIEAVFFEEFPQVAAQVYEERTGQELPAPQTPSPRLPGGEPWSAERGDLEQRLPRLWGKYRR